MAHDLNQVYYYNKIMKEMCCMGNNNAGTCMHIQVIIVAPL